MINLKVFSVPTDLPSITGPAEQPVKHRLFGKKAFVTLAAIAIVAAVALALFIPQGGATIPLNVDFNVGEKMVYDNTVTMTLDSYNMGSNAHPALNNMTLNSQQTIDVIGFDGENFLLNHTITMTVLDKPLSFSLTEKMNKTGYSTYLLNLGNTQTEVPNAGFTSQSTLAQILSRPEAKVGDSITIPYPAVSSIIHTTGDLTVKFNNVEDLTVPAGTYRVFRVDLTSNNLKVTFNPQTASNTSIALPNNLNITLDINAHIYIEYGTMRQIKSTMTETSTYQSSTLNMTSYTATEMTMVQYIKP
jgi:hypothetical protein